MNLRRIVAALTIVIAPISLHSQGCDLTNYTTATLIGPAMFPYTDGAGVTVSATVFNVPTLGNFTYTCNANTFNCSNPAWWHRYNTGWIHFTFSQPVTKFTMVLNGSNTGEVFTFTPNAGTVTLSDYCTTFTAAGNQLTCNGSLGTIVSANHPTGETDYWVYHNGVGAGSRMTLLDCFVTTPLPVEMTTFNGSPNGESNRLFWETSSEINNDYFILERSEDANVYTELGRRDGNGNSNSSQFYELLDEQPYPTSYYRLKQVDFNGDFKYYGPIAINNAEADPFTVGNAYPNPALNYFNLPINSFDKSSSCGILVFDDIGRLKQKSLIEINGATDVSINCTGWAAGIYNIVVVNNDTGQETTQRILIN